jgi:hypothetical protein
LKKVFKVTFAKKRNGKREFFSVGHTDRKKRNKKVRKKKETKERKTFFPENKIKAKFSILLNRKLCQLKVDRE